MNDFSPVHEIEPELRDGVVQHVGDTATTRITRRLVWDGFLAGFCLMFFLGALQVAPLRLLTISDHPSHAISAEKTSQRDLWNFDLLLYLVNGFAALLTIAAYYASRRRLLRFGTPGVAVVVKRRSEDRLFYHLTYEFTFSEYKIYTRELPVSVEQYERYPEGAPITVLYPPHESYRAEAYIGIRQAEIVGVARPEGQLN